MKRILALVATSTMTAAVLATPAAADPVSAGSASAYGATVALAGTDVIPPLPHVTIELPPGGEAEETIVDLPAGPLAVNGTINASAVAHSVSDVTSQLTVDVQEVEGPYNVAAVSLIEGLDVLLDVAGDGVSLVSAAAVRAEAVAVCRAGAIEYSASSEIIDLDVAGTDIPLNAPVTQLIDAIAEVLATSGLDAVVDVDRNVVTELDGGGIAVDALRISVVEAGGPVALVTIGHAEVSGATCGAAPECSDAVDNADGEDTLADADDPGCHTDGNAGNPASYDPNDGDETDGARPECADTVDNADGEDTLADADDPGCHTDENAGNPASYDPNDPSEADRPAPAGALPRTGGAADVAVVGGSLLGALALGLHALRRRALV